MQHAALPPELVLNALYECADELRRTLLLEAQIEQLVSLDLKTTQQN